MALLQKVEELKKQKIAVEKAKRGDDAAVPGVQQQKLRVCEVALINFYAFICICVCLKSCCDCVVFLYIIIVIIIIILELRFVSFAVRQ